MGRKILIESKSQSSNLRRLTMSSLLPQHDCGSAAMPPIPGVLFVFFGFERGVRQLHDL